MVPSGGSTKSVRVSLYLLRTVTRDHRSCLEYEAEYALSERRAGQSTSKYCTQSPRYHSSRLPLSQFAKGGKSQMEWVSMTSYFGAPSC